MDETGDASWRWLVWYLLIIYGIQFTVQGITGLMETGWVSAAVWFTGAGMVALVAVFVNRVMLREESEGATA